jgi:hypothetical protein
MDALKSSLEHLSASQHKVAEEILLRRHKAISRGDDNFALTNWIVHDIELKEGQETPCYDPQRMTLYHKREKIRWSMISSMRGSLNRQSCHGDLMLSWSRRRTLMEAGKRMVVFA